MPRALVAQTNTYYVWTAPECLLSPEENLKKDRGTAWTWFIERSTLHYFDDKLVEHLQSGMINATNDIEYENIDLDEDGSAWGLDSSDEEED